MKFQMTLLMAAVLALPMATSAQGNSVEQEQNMTAAGDAFAAIGSFVGDVRFSEEDVKNVLELWPEFEDLGDEVTSRLSRDVDSAADIKAALEEPAYVAWVEKHELDRENWLRRALRIQLLLAKDDFDAQGAEQRAQMQQQLKEMEKMRAQVGEATYQKMMQTMKSSMAMMDSMTETMASLPPASDDERALLDKYRKQLKRVVD
jgi:hypothetical protein